MATFCGELLNYISVAREWVAYIKVPTLFVVPENPEDFRRSLDRDD